MAHDPRSEFMQAYTPCHEPFARYCAALAYGRMDAQDLMQDVLLSGSGNADVRGLSIAKGGQVTAMGSGDVLLNSTVPLKVVTMGSGRVRNTAGQAPNADGNGED